MWILLHWIYMFAGKTLVSFTTLISLDDFKKWHHNLNCFKKINKENFIEAVKTSGLSDQTKFELNEINKIKDYFN